MIGAIAGDIIGSAYESIPVKNTDFELFGVGSNFTDDTVLTIAVADCLLNKKDYAITIKEYGRRYPNSGFGTLFNRWLFSEEYKPYNSCGNGSAMRVSPIGFALNNIEEVLKESKRSAEITHNHPEGIKGAQATAMAVFLARKGSSKKEIKAFIEDKFNYNLTASIEVLRSMYVFNETCQKTVPEAIIAFLDSTDYEDAIRKAVSLRGDSDTLACIAGGIAQAFYKKIPETIIKTARSFLTPDLLNVLDSFEEKYKLI